MNPADIEKLISDGLPDSVVRIESPDNTHFEAVVVSSEFEGLKPIARHQRVYQCLGTLMGNEIHAMSIRAFTPDEWTDAKGP